MNSIWSRVGLLISPTIRLSLVHLLVIMIMSISFSIVIYRTSDYQFRQPLPANQTGSSTGTAFKKTPSSVNKEVLSVLDETFEYTRRELLLKLIWLNVAVLGIGAVFSYLLSRWSLHPIEEAIDAQVRFVSDASHELRTPLAILQTTNEVALRDRRLTSKVARELAVSNLNETKRMQGLTSALLELARSPRSVPHLEPVNIQDVVAEAMASIVKAAQDKDIRIDDRTNKILVMTNLTLLVRMVVIILDNAIKYSPDKSTVTIATDVASGRVKLRILDEGIGIDKSNLPSIFDRFYRVDQSRSTNIAPGYGLGLSIAKKLSEQLGLSILVDSRVGQGSEFTIEAPACGPVAS